MNIVLLLLALLMVPPNVSRRPGDWCDVVSGPAGVTFVRSTGREIIAERANGTRRWNVVLPEETLYLRAAADPTDTVMAIAQGHDSGLAYVFGSSGIRGLGPSFGQNAVAANWTAGAGFTYYVFVSPTLYHVYNSIGCSPCSVTVPATSQGFRDVRPDGTVRLGDTDFTAVLGGRQMWEMSTRGDLTVGQCDPAAVCAYAGARPFTAIDGDGFEPHVAQDLDGSYFVAARTPMGATLAHLIKPYPVDEVPRPIIVPPPTPVPALKAPTVVVDVFALGPRNGLPDGDLLVFHDPNNGTKVRVWVAGGSAFMSIEYPGLPVGQTGAKRMVR